MKANKKQGTCVSYDKEDYSFCASKTENQLIKAPEYLTFNLCEDNDVTQSDERVQLLVSI